MLLLFGSLQLHQEKIVGVPLSEGLFIHPEGNLVNMVVSPEEKNALKSGIVDNEYLAEKIYKVFKDSFDFMIFLYNDEEKPDSLYFGKCFPVQNQVSGIGKRVFDDSPKYRSEGRLKGIIHLRRNDAVREGPILHELIHVWANEFLETDAKGHWGFTGVGGQLGGFQRLVHLRDEYYKGFVEGQTGFSPETNWGNAVPYGSLELYLMGLLPESEVPPIQIAINAKGNPSINGLFTADRIDSICIEDLIAVHGPRIPDQQSAQNEYRGIVVLVSSAPVSAPLMDRISEDIHQFSLPHQPEQNWRKLRHWRGKENFFTATRGLACLELGNLEEAMRSPLSSDEITLR